MANGCNPFFSCVGCRRKMAARLLFAAVAVCAAFVLGCARSQATEIEGRNLPEYNVPSQQSIAALMEPFVTHYEFAEALLTGDEELATSLHERYDEAPWFYALDEGATEEDIRLALVDLYGVDSSEGYLGLRSLIARGSSGVEGLYDDLVAEYGVKSVSEAMDAEINGIEDAALYNVSYLMNGYVSGVRASQIHGYLQERLQGRDES